MIPRKKKDLKKDGAQKSAPKKGRARTKKVRLNKDGTPRKKQAKLNAPSKAYALAQGWDADITEYWNSFARKRKDLYGFIDMVVSKPGIGIVGVQITTKQNVNARIKKIESLPSYYKWKESKGLVEVWGWYQDKDEAWKLEITVL